MYRWLALMDEYGDELSYDGYARIRIPETHDEWEVHRFSRWPGPEPIIIAGVWVCDSETSRMRDGFFLQVVKAIRRGEFINIHLGPDRRDLTVASRLHGDA